MSIAHIQFVEGNGKMNRHVLVLNQNYEPMHVCNVKRAVTMIYLGKAQIIEKESDWVRSVSLAIPFPSVVRLEEYIRTPYREDIILSRKNILKRDRHRCQYCGNGNVPLTVDHVIPKVKGGLESWDNLVCACIECNNRKGNRTPEEAGMKLIRRPR
ncbi:MAG: HNH endonuclease, partial [Fidelibacterota bacterium]